MNDRRSRREGRGSRTIQAWVVASVATVTFASAASASAAVIYVDINPDRSVFGDNFIFDIDNDGDKDLIFSNSQDCLGRCHTYSTVSALSGGIVVTGGDVTPLATGTFVGPAGTYGPNGLFAEDFFGGGGPFLENGVWDDNLLAFMGFSFMNATGLHYGWARVKVNETNNDLIVYDAAYEDVADTAIQAPAAPEPALFALVLLGAGGVAARRLRRRGYRTTP